MNVVEPFNANKVIQPNVLPKKYNPLKDANFWIAFILGGGPVLFVVFIQQGSIIQFFPAFLILIVWESWIIFKKGRSGSLVVGLIVSIITFVIFLFLNSIVEDIKMNRKLDNFNKTYQQERNAKIQNELNSGVKNLR